MAEMRHLGDQGAFLLTKDPTAAATFFVAAHAIAIQLRAMEDASVLSLLLARAWLRAGHLHKSLKYARRATREEPNAARTDKAEPLPVAAYTLARVCERAADLTTDRTKVRRAAILYRESARSYFAASASTGNESYRSFGEACARRARELEVESTSES